jgi:hypothetical protein
VWDWSIENSRLACWAMRKMALLKPGTTPYTRNGVGINPPKDGSPNWDNTTEKISSAYCFLGNGAKNKCLLAFLSVAPGLYSPTTAPEMLVGVSQHHTKFIFPANSARNACWCFLASHQVYIPRQRRQKYLLTLLSLTAK